MDGEVVGEGEFVVSFAVEVDAEVDVLEMVDEGEAEMLVLVIGEFLLRVDQVGLFRVIGVLGVEMAGIGDSYFQLRKLFRVVGNK